MRRRSRLTVAAVLASGAAVVAAAQPAQADTVGASYSAAVNVQAGGGVDPTIGTTGSLAGLLDFVQPVLDQFATPVASAISQLPGTAVSGLVNAATGSLVANSTGSQSAPSSGTWPACSDSGWNSTNCYNASTTAAAGGVPVSLSLGAAKGWASSDSSTAAAGSQVASASVTALGLNVATVDTAQSVTSCTGPNGSQSGSCTSSPSFGTANLVGGGVKVTSAADGSLLVSVGGASPVPVGSLPGQSTVTWNGSTVAVTASGSSLELAIPMTLDQLLSQLGIADTLSSLNATDDGSTITLDVYVGPWSASSPSRTAGLRIGIGLTADIAVSVLGLVDVTVSQGDSSLGNLAAVELAYTAAAAADSSDGSAPLPTLV